MSRPRDEIFTCLSKAIHSVQTDIKNRLVLEGDQTFITLLWTRENVMSILSKMSDEDVYYCSLLVENHFEAYTDIYVEAVKDEITSRMFENAFRISHL